jgi:hypothetical protein
VVAAHPTVLPAGLGRPKPRQRRLDLDSAGAAVMALANLASVMV